MRFPPHLLFADGTPKWGTRIMTQWLKSLHAPADFPCRSMGFDVIAGGVFCRDCGVEMIKIGHSVLHPHTPVARLAEKHPEMFE